MNKLQLYEQMFKQNKIPNVVFNPGSGAIVEVNEAFAKFYGFSIEEIYNISILDLVNTNDEFVINVLHDLRYDLPKAFKFQGVKKNKSNFSALGAINYLDIDDTLLLSLLIYPEDTDIIVSDYNANIFEDIPSAICIIDSNHKVLTINKEFTKMFGYTLDEVKFKKISDFIAPDDYVFELEENYNKIFNGEVINVDTKRITKNKHIFNCNVFAIPYLYNSKVVGTQVFYTDRTREVENQTELRMFRKIIEHNSDGVFITDADRKIIWVNNAFTDITEYTKKEAIGKTPEILQSGLHGIDFYNSMYNSINKKGSFQGEVWNRKKSGVLYPQWINIFSIKDNFGEITNYVSVFKSLDEIDSINKKFLLMIQKDSLTALYNRTYFVEKVKNLLLNTFDQFYMLFIDIDNFKTINDTLGHKTGDELLVTFAKTLVETFKGQIISRYGGDEFVVFVKDNISKENLITSINSINRFAKINNEDIEVICSVGIAKYPVDSTNTEELISKADKAMYNAKNSGRIFSFYDEIE